MVTFAVLPEKKDELIRALDRFVENSQRAHAPRFTVMTLLWMYLIGHRDFRHVDLRTGMIQTSPLDFKDERFGFTLKTINRKFDDYVQNLDTMDLAPSVGATRLGLSASRERAVGQVIADAYTDPEALKSVRLGLAKTLCAYGSAGLYGMIEEAPQIGSAFGYQVIPPWEIYPFPAATMDQSQTPGLMWRRWVDDETLAKIVGSRQKVTANKDKLARYRIADGYGNEPIHGNAAGSLIVANNARGGEPREEKESQADLHITDLQEIWLRGPRDTVSRYILRSGDAIFVDKKFTTEVVYSPLSFGRFMENGHFYGESLPGLVVSSHRESEKMYSRLFDYVRKLDRFSMILFPQGMVDTKQFVESPYGAVFGYYEPDPYGGQARPITVAPNTPGDFPGRVAQTSMGLIDQVLPTPEILRGEAPGRVESPSALNLLANQAFKSMTSASAAMESMKGSVDRALLSEAMRSFMRSNRSPIPLKRLDHNLIGLKITDQEGELAIGFGSSGGNPIPDVSKLTFSIKEATPRDRVARENEVRQDRMQNVISDLEYTIVCIREDLRNPMYREDVRQTLRAATLKILRLFNDGQTPGQVRSEHANAGRPDVILTLLNEVMSSPEYSFASPEVRSAFVTWKNSVERTLRPPVPDAIGNPEDAAAAELA